MIKQNLDSMNAKKSCNKVFFDVQTTIFSQKPRDYFNPKIFK